MTSRSAPSAWRLLLRVAKVAESLTKAFGPVVAALWIGWQYQQSKVDKRVEATLAYVTRYQGGDSSVGKAQRALADSLWAHAEEIAELRSTRAAASDLDRIRQTILTRIVDTAGQQTGRSPGTGPLEEMDDFYSALVTCIKGDVCDLDSALRFFGCPATEFVENFGPILVARQRLASRFGQDARWIADRARERGTCVD